MMVSTNTMLGKSRALVHKSAASSMLLLTRMHRSITALAMAGGSGPGGGSRRGMGGNWGNGDGQEGQPGARSWWGSLLAGTLLLGGAMGAPVHAANKQPAKSELTIDKVVDSLWAVSGPMLTNLGFSGCVGVAAGIALKKVGQALAFMIGLAFLALQALAYAGFIEVKWTNVHATINRTLDVNKDGRVDEKDFKLVTSHVLAALATGVPSVGGFLTGFAMGVRM